MNREMISNAVGAAKEAIAPIVAPLGLSTAVWNWLRGHDIAWYVGVSSLILIWLQIKDRLFPRKEAKDA